MLGLKNSLICSIEFSEKMTIFFIRLKFRLFSIVPINNSSIPSLMLVWQSFVRSIGFWYLQSSVSISLLSFESLQCPKSFSNRLMIRMPLLGRIMRKSIATSLTTASIYNMSSIDKIFLNLYATLAFCGERTLFWICNLKSYSL